MYLFGQLTVADPGCSEWLVGSVVPVARCLGCSWGLARAARSLCVVRALPSLPEQEITKSTAEKLKMHQKEAKWELGNSALQLPRALALINTVYFIFLKQTLVMHLYLMPVPGVFILSTAEKGNQITPAHPRLAKAGQRQAIMPQE